MKINCLPKTMSQEQALKIAMGGGNIIGKALYGKKDITLKLMYLESREIIFDMTYLDAPLVGLLRRKNKAEPRKQKFRTMVEGTRCGAAYLADPLVVETRDVEEDDIQSSTFTDEKLTRAGKFLCRRLVRRQLGKTVVTEVAEMNKVYRPFYIAFYGEVKMGERVRYLPISADGNSVKRAC